MTAARTLRSVIRDIITLQQPKEFLGQIQLGNPAAIEKMFELWPNISIVGLNPSQYVHILEEAFFDASYEERSKVYVKVRQQSFVFKINFNKLCMQMNLEFISDNKSEYSCEFCGLQGIQKIMLKAHLLKCSFDYRRRSSVVGTLIN